MDIALLLLAPLAGILLGNFLVSRLSGWLLSITGAIRGDNVGLGARGATIGLAVLVNSGPWLLGGVGYWAYSVLSQPHEMGWLLFFGAIAAAFPLWFVVGVRIYMRAKRLEAHKEKVGNAV